MAALPDLETYFASIPQKNKLDMKLDFDHGGVQKDLGTITNSMDEWEGNVAEQLQLTKSEIKAIREEYPRKLPLQTRAALQKWQEKFGPKATYRALITAFVRAGKGDCAEAVCKVLGENFKLVKQLVFQDPTQRYAMYLRGVYKCVLVCTDKFPNLTCNEFIKLALVKGDRVSRSEADEFTKATLHGHIDEIKKKKEPIKLEDVLKPVEGQQNMKCVYMHGAPGIGKSTCVAELCRRWDEINALKRYSLIILLRLREKKVQEAQKMEDLCYHDNKEIQQAVAAKIEASEGKDVLFILDGFDELPTSLRKHSIFIKLIQGTYLSHCTLLVTSRPFATADLYKAQPQIHKQVEVIGFTQIHVQQYAQAFFALQPDVLADFLMYIATHPAIRSLMYIPLNCAITAEIYRYNRTVNRPIPQTMTQLFIELSLTILQRHIGEDNPLAEELTDRLEDLPSQLYKPFSSLAELAFKGLERNEVIFHNLSNSFIHFGFMKSPTELYMGRKSSISHSFLHLTLQEFLCAFHISQLPLNSQKIVLEKHCKTAGWDMVRRFVAGLTRFNGIGWEVVQSRRKVDGKEIVRPFLIRCLYEAQRKSCCESALGDSRIIFDGESFLTAFDCYAVGYCVTNSICKWDLEMGDNESLGDTLLEMLKHGLYSLCKSPPLKQLSHPNILSLSLQRCGLNSTSFNVLAEIIPHMTNLSKFDVSYNPAGDGGLVNLLHALSYLKCLHTLVMCSTGISCSDIEALLDLISPSSSLKQLRIGDKTMSSETTEVMLKTLFSPSSLESLECVSVNWSGQAVTLLEQNNNLTTLEISRSSPEFIISVAIVLRKNSSLKDLNVEPVFPSDDDKAVLFVKMVEMVRTNRTLEILGLSFLLTQDQLLALNVSLQFNRTLKTVKTFKPFSLDFVLDQKLMDTRIAFMIL